MISTFKCYALVLILILNSSFMFLSGFYQETLLVSFALTVAIYLSSGGKVDHGLIIIFALIAIFLLLSWVKWSIWNFQSAVGFVLRIVMGYLAVRVMSRRLFYVFEDITYRLALISLPLFCVGLLVPEVFWFSHDYMSLFPNVFQFDEKSYEGQPKDSLFFYNFSVMRLHQNHGYMWEPTAYAVVLSLALIFRITWNNFRFDFRVLVFLLALASTVSTTGLLVLFTMIIVYFASNKFDAARVLVGVLIAPMLFVVFGQEFMTSKIKNEISNGRNQFEAAEGSISGNTRLSSFLYDMDDLMDNPLLGVGVFPETRYLGAQNLASVNSISNTLVKLGIPFAALLMFAYAASFRKWVTELGAKGWVFVFGTFLMFAWSEEIILLPLFQAFQFYFISDYEYS